MTDEEYYYGHSISPFKPFNSDDLEFLTAIINSKLISWYSAMTFSNFAKDVFPKLNPNDIKQIPIIEPKKNDIQRLVKQIFLLKGSQSDNDISSLESQIDCLVYERYGLTEEEIAIVEATVK